MILGFPAALLCRRRRRRRRYLAWLRRWLDGSAATGVAGRLGIACADGIALGAGVTVGMDVRSGRTRCGGGGGGCWSGSSNEDTSLPGLLLLRQRCGIHRKDLRLRHAGNQAMQLRLQLVSLPRDLRKVRPKSARAIVCVCVCVCERERERESVCVCVCVCVYLCLSVYLSAQVSVGRAPLLLFHYFLLSLSVTLSLFSVTRHVNFFVVFHFLSAD
jgi:hypothetical protein